MLATMSAHEESYEELTAEEAVRLLDLPDPCLLAVLQCCGDDLRSLFSITRAHSRLHKAVSVLDSFQIHMSNIASATWDTVCHQQQVNCALLYLGEHGENIRSVSVTSDIYEPTDQPSIRQLPLGLQLTSLQLDGLRLQLQPGCGFQGVLGAAAGLAALKQLRFSWCKLLDRGDGLEAMLAGLMQLPAGLEHLSINDVRHRSLYDHRWFPTAALQHLQHLTCLELSLIKREGPIQEQPALQPLQALTRLVDLSVLLSVVASIGPTHSLTTSMLSGTHHLTRLGLVHCKLEPDALAGKTLLQHLHLQACDLAGAASGMEQLRSTCSSCSN
jgi:hypothetical protein